MTTVHGTPAHPSDNQTSAAPANTSSKAYFFDRVMHWIGALLLLFMLMNLSTQLHNVDWQIKGQVEHRQDAVETHALIGIILLTVTLLRVVYPFLLNKPLPRVQPRSKAHEWFVKSTHLALYAGIAGLVVTGLAMIDNYEIPISLFGFEFQGTKDEFYQVFPPLHAIHMLLKQAIWWLVAVHFVGILYAKR